MRLFRIDTDHMHVVALAWPFVMLLVALVLGIGALVSAIRGDPRDLTFSRRDWMTIGLMVIWTVDAVSANSQPPLERVAKGTAVVLLGSALAVAFLRLRRRQPPGTNRRGVRAAQHDLPTAPAPATRHDR